MLYFYLLSNQFLFYFWTLNQIWIWNKLGKWKLENKNRKEIGYLRLGLKPLAHLSLHPWPNFVSAQQSLSHQHTGPACQLSVHWATTTPVNTNNMILIVSKP
jgi:hypothetical protein